MSGPLDAEKIYQDYLQARDHTGITRALVAALNPILEGMQAKQADVRRFMRSQTSLNHETQTRLSALEPKPEPRPLQVGDRVILRGRVKGSGESGWTFVPDGELGEEWGWMIRRHTKWERE